MRPILNEPNEYMRRIEFYKKNEISGIAKELEQLLELLGGHRE